MRTWVRALPIAATVLLVGCSPAPAGPTRPARPADGRLPPVMVPAPGPTRPPGCRPGSEEKANVPVAAGRHLGPGAVRRLLLPNAPFAVVARGSWAFASLTSTVAVLHADATLVSDGGGKAAAATRPVLGADRIAKFLLGYAGKLHWSESDFQLVTINGAPGLLLRHPIGGNGTYSFDIVDGRIRAIYVMRNPDKLRAFLERTH